MTEKKRLNVITMGCSKNLVDSERLARIMADAGYVFRCRRFQRR